MNVPKSVLMLSVLAVVVLAASACPAQSYSPQGFRVPDAIAANITDRNGGENIVTLTEVKMQSIPASRVINNNAAANTTYNDDGTSVVNTPKKTVTLVINGRVLELSEN